MIIKNDEIKMLSKIKNSFYEDLKIEFLFHSNHLEGSTFSKENLERLLYERRVQGDHPLDDVIETQNSLNLFDLVISSIDEDLNKFLLLDWHRTLKKGTVDEEIGVVGQWKKYDNRLRFVDLKLATAHEVESKMFNLLEDWKEIEHKTISDIANFHARFEAIHPFQDGNGRIGRFIILKQCINEGIDLIAIDNKYGDEYKSALYIAQSTGDSSKLVDIFEKCQHRLDKKLDMYKDTIQAVKREIKSKHEKNICDDFDEIER